MFFYGPTQETPCSQGVSCVGIVPTGELEGREDLPAASVALSAIVPTGELEGREDKSVGEDESEKIVPTGELEGREDLTLFWMIVG